MGVILAMALVTGGCADPADTAEVALLAKGFKPNPEGYLAAARAGDEDAIQLFKQTRLELEIEHKDLQRDAALAALEAEQDDVLKILNSKESTEDFDFNVRDSDGRTPLGAALISGRYVMAEKILARGASVSIPLVEGGKPPLVDAVNRGDMEAMDLLLKFGADPGDVLGEIAEFAWGSIDPKSDATLAKLIGGMDVKIGGEADDDLAGSGKIVSGLVDRGMYLSAEALVKRGADVSMVGAGVLISAVSERDQTKLQALLEIGIDPDGFGSAEETALEWAVANNDQPAVETLLEFGADGSRGLFSAVVAGNGSLVRLLLESGASPDGKGEKGQDTPLCVAVGRSDPDMVSWLMEAGADASLAGALGQPPLILAAAAQDEPVLRALLDGGADPDIRSKYPHSLAFRELVDGDKTLNFYLRNDTRLTPLMFSAGHGDVGSLNALLDADANKWLYTGKYKRYSVSFAAEKKNIYMQQRLLGRNPGAEKVKREIVVDLSDQRVRMYEDGKEVFSSKVSTGKAGHRTPTGEYVISNKYKSWTSTIYHSSMPYFQRLSWGAFGFHVGYVPNYPASHGCIRMPRNSAIELFRRTEMGDFVRIVP